MHCIFKTRKNSWYFRTLRSNLWICKTKESETLSSANKRVSNILKKADKISINPIDENLLIENEEIMLHKVLLDLEPKINQCLIKNDFISALKNLVILNTPINNFFEKVMVNADDSKIKNNRYSLLFKLRQNLNCVADISKLASWDEISDFG